MVEFEYYQMKNLDMQLKYAFKGRVLALFFKIWMNIIRIKFTSFITKRNYKKSKLPAYAEI